MTCSFNRFFQIALVGAALLMQAGPVSAAEKSALKAGSGSDLARAYGCGQCHSNDSKILIEGVPRIAGQKFTYLLHQLRLFKVGDASYNGERIASRHHSVMNELAKKLTDAQLRKIALFYGSRECTAAPAAAEPGPQATECQTLRNLSWRSADKSVARQPLPRRPGQNLSQPHDPAAMEQPNGFGKRYRPLPPAG